MSIASTQELLTAYWQNHDAQYMTPDATLTDTSTGQVVSGPEAIHQMIHYLYNVAFDAGLEEMCPMFTENGAVLEGQFVGTHQSEFAGIPATGRRVRVPICVVYDTENNLVKHIRVYLQAAVLMQQLTA